MALARPHPRLWFRRLAFLPALLLVMSDAPRSDRAGHAPRGDAPQGGASSAGLLTTPAATLDGGAPLDFFGHSVASAGDINGDGYSDVIVGAKGYAGNTGRAYLHLGGPTGLALTPATVLTGEAPSSCFGSSVASAGDVNGDGYADVVVGAPCHASDAGRVYVYLGSASGLALPASRTLDGIAGYQFGASVAYAGDVNGDGFSDVVVGAPGYQSSTGRAYIYLGGSTGLSGVALISPTGKATANYFGWSVSSAGDMDRDGYDDVIVGAWGYDNENGEAYVYRGGQSGPSANSPMVITYQQGDNGAFGKSVASAGDVNGDGYSDVVIGADQGYSSWGAVYVFAGPDGAFSSSSVMMGGNTGFSVACAGDINGDGLGDYVFGAPGEGSDGLYRGEVWVNGSRGSFAELTVETTGALFGFSVSSAGDINGDGYSDLIVGAPGEGGHRGRAYVYLGRAGAPGSATVLEHDHSGSGWALFGAGDVNGDGFADTIVGSGGTVQGEERLRYYPGQAGGMPTTPAVTVAPPVGERFWAASPAGDVNGDGYSDVVTRGASASNKAVVHLYSGGLGGISGSPSTTLAEPSVELYGLEVTAGDVNGDGYADVIVGDGWSRVFVYFGGAGGLSASPGFVGASGGSPLAMGDVNGDGFADLVAASQTSGRNRGRVVVHWGGPTGLSPAPGAVILGSAEGDSEGNGGDFFGGEVAVADVNGDGYADVVATGAQPRRICVYHGGPAGLPTSASTVLTVSDQTHVEALAPAGDVNGDGCADLILTSKNIAGTLWSVWLHLGGPVGLAATPIEVRGASSEPIERVASLGDANGDGYADVAVAVASAAYDEVTSVVHPGNGGFGRALRPAAWKAVDASSPIADGGASDSQTQFRLLAWLSGPFGRTGAKLEWEVKPLGTPFNGTNTSRSPNWIDTQVPGGAAVGAASGLAPGTPYHWRLRILYHPAKSPLLPHSRWFTQPWRSWNETMVRTKSNTLCTAFSVLPASVLTRYPAGSQGIALTGTSPAGCVGGVWSAAGNGSWLTVSPMSGAGAGAVTVSWAENGSAGSRSSAVTVAGNSVSVFQSAPSAPAFTDEPLVARATIVKAVHVNELRRAIDDLRGRNGLAAYSWADTTLAGTVVTTAHVLELRAALAAAYAAAHRSPPAYTDPTLSPHLTAIKASHLNEIRQAVLTLW